MKTIFPLAVVIFIFTGCRLNQVSNKNLVKALNLSEIKINYHKNLSFITDSDTSDNYTAVLKEFCGLDTNAFILEIYDRSHKIIKSSILDLPRHKAMINFCTNNYVVVGFSCGGPCYSQVFIFLDEHKSNKQFDFVNRVSNDDNIITYIKNEEFEKLIVYNLNNDKEIIIEVNDRIPMNYALMDRIYLKNNKLFFEYQSIKTEKRFESLNMLFD